jgi:disulfide bond formation protein DsbB
MKFIDKIIKNTSKLLSGMTAATPTIISTGINACSGGVCALSVTSATSTGAISLGATATAASFGGAYNYQEWGLKAAPVISHAHPPLMIMLSVALLWLSVTWAVLKLVNYPVYAWALSISGLLATASELLWLPGGIYPHYVILVTAISGLLIIPWMPALQNMSKKWHDIIKWTSIGLCTISLLTALYLQFWLNWVPCPLCWVQRIAVLWVILFFAKAKYKTALIGVFSGITAIWLQSVEMGKSVLSHKLVGVCTNLGESCGLAAHKELFGVGILWWSLGLFTLLYMATLMLMARKVKLS